MLNLINFFTDESLWGSYLAFEFLFICWAFIYVSL